MRSTIGQSTEPLQGGIVVVVALVSVGELVSVEDAPLRFTLLRSKGR